MANLRTPHICASPSDFASTVLMPGDPKRSRYVAENFLSDIKLINDVRGIQGYTGKIDGVSVSVMASGMGMPSISIYAHELFNFFEVDNIIRIGTMGAYADNIGLRDVVLAMSASTDSNLQNNLGIMGHFNPCASFELVSKAKDVASEMGISTAVGSVLTSDCFYNPDLNYAEKWRNLSVLGVDMETAALYMKAAEFGKNALSVLTVSNHIFTGASLDASERESSMNDMIKIALGVAKRL